MAEPKAPTATEVDFIQSQANEAQSNSMDSDGLKSGLAEQARNATGREHELTLKQAFRLYPKAIAFSLIFSAAVIMEGYDLALLGGFYGYSASVISRIDYSPCHNAQLTNLQFPE